MEVISTKMIDKIHKMDLSNRQIKVCEIIGDTRFRKGENGKVIKVKKSISSLHFTVLMAKIKEVRCHTPYLNGSAKKDLLRTRRSLPKKKKKVSKS